MPGGSIATDLLDQIAIGCIYSVDGDESTALHAMSLKVSNLNKHKTEVLRTSEAFY